MPVRTLPGPLTRLQSVAAQRRLPPDGFLVPTSRLTQHRWPSSPHSAAPLPPQHARAEA
jgi:hypothetical protein